MSFLTIHKLYETAYQRTELHQFLSLLISVSPTFNTPKASKKMWYLDPQY